MVLINTNYKSYKYESERCFYQSAPRIEIMKQSAILFLSGLALFVCLSGTS